MKALKKPLSLLMALLMCFGVFAGTGVTAFAAGETMTTYMVDIPRASDPNKAGWGHPAFNFLGGWSTGAADHFSVHTQDSFTGKAIYCIEPGSLQVSYPAYGGQGYNPLSVQTASHIPAYRRPQGTGGKAALRRRARQREAAYRFESTF